MSVKVLLREIGMVDYKIAILNERDQDSAPRVSKEKAKIKANEALLEQARVVNLYDMKLYELGSIIIYYCDNVRFKI